MSRILVVDDEFDLRRAVRVILESEGYEVSECDDGREALDTLQNTSPDLILLDVMMPFVNGLEVLKQLRQLPEKRMIPVILMTGIVPQRAADAAQWDALLQKPFDIDTLIDTVARQLERKTKGQVKY